MAIHKKPDANQVAEAMWAKDAAAHWAGLSLVEVAPGRAVLSLTVTAEQCNGHGTCHGGVLFMLADSAFAYACNSRNQSTVAQHATVSFIKPAFAGDILRAEAREVSLAGRSGIYDVAVTREGAQIAEFRGMSRAVPGQILSTPTLPGQNSQETP